MFITNSHCTEVVHSADGGSFGQPQSYSPTIGTELLDPEPFECGWAGFEDPCREADAALVSAEAPLDFATIGRTIERLGGEAVNAALTIDEMNPTIPVIYRNNDVFENQTLDKIGQTTGWTYGAVEDTCWDYDFDGWVRRCADRVDYSSDEGDSGSPVFRFTQDGSADLRGVHFGRIEGFGGVGFYDALMSDLGQIEKDLGPLIVHENPQVTVSIDGPTAVPKNAICQWVADVTPGESPYSYEWYRDGQPVSTSASYIADTGTTTFDLEVYVTDSRSDTAWDMITVFPGSGNDCAV